VTHRTRYMLLMLVIVASFGLRVGGALASPAEPTGADAAVFARGLVGAPYAWGGESPRTGFDCSGLVRYVYGHFGLELPHYTGAQFQVGRRVARSALRPGDLVFFDGLAHVGLYLGEGQFVHAPRPGKRVQIDRLAEPWYASSYDGARRIVAA
jgi:peptidoglycan DL-endopeptidase CwlO